MTDIKEAHEKARGAARDAGQLYFPEVLEAMLSAYLASLETSGFVIAPVEATEDMLRDGKWFSPECAVKGCQSLVFAGRLATLDAAAVDGDARGNSAFKFIVGEHVRKPSGYAFDGIVRSAFMVAGGDRYVVESDAAPGLLHIFNGSQLEGKRK